MVYFIDGERFPGHRSRQGDHYERQPSTLPRLDIPFAQNIATSLWKESVGAESLSDSGANDQSFVKSFVPVEKLFLYVSAACPWAHRTLLARKVLKLDDLIEVSVVNPVRDDDFGWEFAQSGSSSDAAEFGVDGGGSLCESELDPTGDKRGTGFRYVRGSFVIL